MTTPAINPVSVDPASVASLNAARANAVSSGQDAYGGNLANVGTYTNSGATPPVMTPGALSSPPAPVTIGPAPTNTSATTIGSTVDSTMASLGSAVANAKASKDASLEGLLRAIESPGTDQATSQIYQSAGVDAAESSLDQANQAILAEDQSLTNKVTAIRANTQGMSEGAMEQEVQRVTDASNLRKANLAVIQSAANGRFSTAKDIADRAVAAFTEGRQNHIDALQTIWEANKDDFSTEENQQFQAAQTERQSQLQIEAHKQEAVFDQSIKQNDPGYQLQLQQERVNLGLDPKTGQPMVNSGGAGANVPQLLQPYYKTASNGTPYADLSSLTPTQKATYAQIASNAGIKPIFDSGTAGKLNAIAVSKQNLGNIIDTFNQVPQTKDIPAAQGLANSIKAFFGDTTIKSFNAWRTAVINNVQALAGGEGSGLRINQAEIDAAMKNDLPNLTGVNADTKASAQKKIDTLTSQLQNWEDRILGTNTPAPAASSATAPQEGDTHSYGGVTYKVVNGQWVPQ